MYKDLVKLVLALGLMVGSFGVSAKDYPTEQWYTTYDYDWYKAKGAVMNLTECEKSKSAGDWIEEVNQTGMAMQVINDVAINGKVVETTIVVTTKTFPLAQRYFRSISRCKKYLTTVAQEAKKEKGRQESLLNKYK